MGGEPSQDWDLKRIALYGTVFGIAYGVIRLYFQLGDAINPPATAARSAGNLLGFVVGAALGGAFLAVMIGFFRNMLRR